MAYFDEDDDVWVELPLLLELPSVARVVVVEEDPVDVDKYRQVLLIRAARGAAMATTAGKADRDTVIAFTACILRFTRYAIGREE